MIVSAVGAVIFFYLYTDAPCCINGSKVLPLRSVGPSYHGCGSLYPGELFPLDPVNGEDVPQSKMPITDQERTISVSGIRGLGIARISIANNCSSDIGPEPIGGVDSACSNWSRS